MIKSFQLFDSIYVCMYSYIQYSLIDYFLLLHYLENYYTSRWLFVFSILIPFKDIQGELLKGIERKLKKY